MNRAYHEMYEASWGDALEERLFEKRVNIGTLSKRTNISTGAIHNYISEGITPNVVYAYVICQALEWTVEDWAKRAEEIREHRDEIRRKYAIYD